MILLSVHARFPEREVAAYLGTLAPGTVVLLAGVGPGEARAIRAAHARGLTVNRVATPAPRDGIAPAYLRNAALAATPGVAEARIFLSGRARPQLHLVAAARAAGIPTLVKTPGEPWRPPEEVAAVPPAEPAPYEVPEATVADLLGEVEPGRYDLDLVP